MKKIVSIIFTLFYVTIASFAEDVTFNSFTGITSKGTASKTYSVNDLSIQFTSAYKSGKQYGVAYSNGKLQFKSYNKDVSIKITAPEGVMINKVYFACNPEFLSGATIVGIKGEKTYTNNISYDSTTGTITNTNDCNVIYVTHNFASATAITEIVVTYATYESSVELYDNDNYELGDDVFTPKVTYTRTLPTSRYGTMCLPFPFKVSSSFGVYVPVGYSEEGGLEIEPVAKGTIIPAAYPVIYKAKASATTLSVVSKNVILTTESYDENDECSYTESSVDCNWLFHMKGTLSKKIITEGYYIAKDAFHSADGESVAINKYRGYYKIQNVSGTLATMSFAKIRTTDGEEVSLDENYESTSIEEINNTENVEIFNVGGVKTNTLSRGMNIVKTADGVKKIFK